MGKERCVILAAWRFQFQACKGGALHAPRQRETETERQRQRQRQSDRATDRERHRETERQRETSLGNETMSIPTYRSRLRYRKLVLESCTVSSFAGGHVCDCLLHSPLSD